MLALMSANKRRGSVGTGRRARLRILCILLAYGFKSRLPHRELKSMRFQLFLFLGGKSFGLPPRNKMHFVQKCAAREDCACSRNLFSFYKHIL